MLVLDSSFLQRLFNLVAFKDSTFVLSHILEISACWLSADFSQSPDHHKQSDNLLDSRVQVMLKSAQCPHRPQALVTGMIGMAIRAEFTSCPTCSSRVIPRPLLPALPPPLPHPHASAVLPCPLLLPRTDCRALWRYVSVSVCPRWLTTWITSPYTWLENNHEKPVV